MKKDYTGWIVAAVVLGAFIVLICAWGFFFWLASQNRVADVSLEAPQARSVAPQIQQAEDTAPAAEGRLAQ